MFCLPLLTKTYAQTKQESIKEMFHLMHQDSLVDKMFSTVIPSMVNQMQAQMQVDSAAREHSKEAMKTVMQTVKEISKKMLDEDMVALYDKYFSQSEINDFIAFYKSSSGQKLIQMTPDISKDLMMVMVQKYLPELQKAMKAKVEEMKKTDKK